MREKSPPTVGDRVRLARHRAPTAVREGTARVIAVETLRLTHQAVVSLDQAPADAASDDLWRRWPLSDVIVVRRALTASDDA